VILRYQLTPSARQDVDRITDFIAEDNVEAALRVHDALEEAFRHLAERPEMGHARADLTARPVRFWSVYSYLIVYDPASSPLTIVAVLHGARDVEHILKS
jgi:plasmid stabilization system protein ParE